MLQNVLKSRFSDRIDRACCNEAALHRREVECVVAVPACNAAGRILRCIDALDSQSRIDQYEYAALVLVHGSTDGTYATLARQRDRWRIPLVAIDIRFAARQGHAGVDRHMASSLALSMTDTRDSLLFITDADSVVPTDWVANYRTLLRQGYEAVVGLAEPLSDDDADLPASLRRRSDCEGRYVALLDQIESLVDPITHDPWPRHYSMSGANIAMRAKVFAELEEQVSPASGHDKALMDGLESRDYRIRHDTSSRVLSSGRLFGHAPETLCHERIESASTAFLRASCRARLRQLRAGHAGPAAIAHCVSLAMDLHVAPVHVESAVHALHFGSAWRRLESLSRVLVRRPLAPAQLPHETELARKLLAELSLGDAPRQLGVDEPLAWGHVENACLAAPTRSPAAEISGRRWALACSKGFYE